MQFIGLCTCITLVLSDQSFMQFICSVSSVVCVFSGSLYSSVVHQFAGHVHVVVAVVCSEGCKVRGYPAESRMLPRGC